jgi:hypothetical protein
MVFSFTFNGSAVRPVDPRLKVEFVDSTGKKVGGPLSQTLAASADPGVPEIPPVADQPHGEPVQPPARAGSGTQSAIPVPEPQGSAVFLAGLGLMGLVAGRKRRP